MLFCVKWDPVSKLCKLFWTFELCTNKLTNRYGSDEQAHHTPTFSDKLLAFVESFRNKHLDLKSIFFTQSKQCIFHITVFLCLGRCEQDILCFHAVYSHPGLSGSAQDT